MGFFLKGLLNKMNNIAFVIFLIVMGIFIFLSDFFTYQVTKYQFNHSEIYNSCGVFDNYQRVNESHSGRVELITTYMNINSNIGNFRFMYHGRLHKNIPNFKEMKKGDKVCFEYIKPYFKKKYGENFIKSIKVNDGE